MAVTRDEGHVMAIEDARDLKTQDVEARAPRRILPAHRCLPPLPSGCRDAADLSGIGRNEVGRQGSSFVSRVARMTAKSARHFGFAITASRHSIPGASTRKPPEKTGFRALAAP